MRNKVVCAASVVLAIQVSACGEEQVSWKLVETRDAGNEVVVVSTEARACKDFAASSDEREAVVRIDVRASGRCSGDTNMSLPSPPRLVVRLSKPLGGRRIVGDHLAKPIASSRPLPANMFLSLTESRVPETVGLNRGDAVQLWRNLQIDPQIQGTGNVVLRQTPVGGSPLAQQAEEIALRESGKPLLPVVLHLGP